jgi:NAD(P)-dependent dehydrogenase (short-subunit alcohol dehydrogenase family)
VCADLNLEGAARTADDIKDEGGSARAVRVDVSDGESVRHMFGDILLHEGSLRVAFNNAGIPMRRTTFAELSAEEWDRQLRVNLTSVFWCCKYAFGPMKAGGGGAIVNTASLSAVKARTGFSAYAVAKAGVVQLTRVLAQEFAPSIRVNSISPLSTETPMLEQLRPPDQSLEDFKAGMRSGVPLGRLNRPADITGAALFLASDDAAMITGVNLVIDGGSG